MLYVSRRVGYDKFGIVDTDDGVEEVVGYGVLLPVVDLGIEVKGIDLEDNRFAQSALFAVKPYQAPEYTTPLQAKTSMLRHVDIVVYKDAIVGVTTHPWDIKEPVTIRLSDFGTHCAEGCLRDNEKIGKHKVTLILDDKIHLDDLSLSLASNDSGFSLGVEGAGFVFDLREVTSMRTIDMVYRNLWRRNNNEAAISVIDDKERKREWLRFCGARMGY